MQITEVTAKIEQFLLESLNHRYNGQVKSYYFTEEIELAARKVVNRTAKLELKFTGNPEFQKYVYRLPQTRIYYTLYQNLKSRIIFIDYFNVHILVFYGENAEATLLNRTRLKLLDIGRQVLLPAASSRHLSGGQQVFLAAPADLRKKIPSLLHLLNEIKRKEYALNPVGALQSENGDLLAAIDRNFARLKYIGAGGKLHPAVIESPLLLYYLELFLQTARFGPLLAFFQSEKVRAFFFGHSLRRLFLLRFKKFLEIYQQKIPSWLAGLKAEGVKSEDSFEYLQQRLEPITAADRQKIQQFWEALNVPALEIYWQRRWNGNPAEFFAFLLLSVQLHFFWAERCRDKLFSMAKDEQKALLGLLFDLGRFAHFSLNGSFRVSSWMLNAHTKIQNHGLFEVDFHRFGKRTFSKLNNAADGISVKIDKAVEFQWSFERREMKLLPLIWRPPEATPDFKFHEMRVGSFVLRVPAVWEQFVVHINEARFKWIRKKRRFQLTVKAQQKIKDEIIVNGQTLNIENVYQKYYYPIPSQESRWYVGLYDRQGIGVEKCHARRSDLLIKGLALDERGIMHETVNFKVQNSKRNHKISTNGLQLHRLPVGRIPVAFRLTARRCQPLDGQIEDCEAYFKRLLLLSGVELLNKLVVWLAEEQEVFTVKEIFACKLGFVPKINVTYGKEFNPTSETINMLVSTTPQADIALLDGVEFRLQMRKTIKYWWIRPKALGEVLERLFFIQKVVKI
ncbi:hypothetical protein ACX8XP_07320 [Calditrichota bacterium LG25]